MTPSVVRFMRGLYSAWPRASPFGAGIASDSTLGDFSLLSPDKRRKRALDGCLGHRSGAVDAGLDDSYARMPRDRM